MPAGHPRGAASGGVLKARTSGRASMDRGKALAEGQDKLRAAVDGDGMRGVVVVAECSRLGGRLGLWTAIRGEVEAGGRAVGGKR